MRLTIIVALFISIGFAQTQRPMSFLDAISVKNIQGGTLSPDGKYFLYGLSSTDWKKGKRFTDLWLVETDKGPSSARQMTFTPDKNEDAPLWLGDSRRFVFQSNRDAAEGKPTNQVYVMHRDGGEARRISDAKEGTTSMSVSNDGRWIGYLAGKEEDRQLWLIPTDSIESSKPRLALKHAAPVAWWEFSRDSRSVIFTSPDSISSSDKKRKDKKFDVRIRNEASAPHHLWILDMTARTERRLTSGNEYSVGSVAMSRDGKWAGFRGTPNDRYKRTITEASTFSDLYLANIASGSVERLTTNTDIGESSLSFSPDNSLIAFSADEDFTYFRNSRVYVRPVGSAGGQFRKIGTGFDIDVSVSFWKDDASTIYFTEGMKSTSQVFALNVSSGSVKQITDEAGTVSANFDERTGRLFVTVATPTEPPNAHVVPRIEDLGKRSAWKRLTDINPEVREMALGKTELARWTSIDGTPVEGILVLPQGIALGTRVPLIVQIHGGPAGAVTQSFIAGYGNYSHVFAGAGYACLLPNYRGSTNYGEKFKMAISGDYFRRGYEDIMSGVDALIARGIVDSTRMGVMGWSAGGHWSNWILTHTNRFKAISSGAGAMNWTSMYAQSDIQRGREFYFGGKPYDRFEHFWDVSPMKYIANAATPTLIHVVDGDPRVPRPQSEELHMALRQRGIPTEFLVYPGSTHGITEVRNQMVKMVTEFRWMEKWVRGRESWFDWNEMLESLRDAPDEKPAEN